MVNLSADLTLRYDELVQYARDVWVYVQQNRFDDAIELANELTILAELSIHEPDALAYSACAAWGRGYTNWGKNSFQLVDEFARAIADFKALGKPREAARVSILIGYAFSCINKTAEAEASLAFAESYFKDDSQYLGWSSIYQNRSEIARRMGNHDAMLKAAQQAEIFSQNLQNKWDRHHVHKRSQINQIVAYLGLGRFDDAEKLLDVVKNDADSDLLLGKVWLNYANLFESQGKLFQALNALNQARRYFEADLSSDEVSSEKGNPANIATARTEEGKVFAQLGMYETAYTVAKLAADSHLVCGQYSEAAESLLQAAQYIEMYNGSLDMANQLIQSLKEIDLRENPVLRCYAEAAEIRFKRYRSVDQGMQAFHLLNEKRIELESYQLRESAQNVQLSQARLLAPFDKEKSKQLLDELLQQVLTPKQRRSVLQIYTKLVPPEHANIIWQELIDLDRDLRQSIPADQLKSHLVQQQNKTQNRYVKYLIEVGKSDEAFDTHLEAKGAVWYELSSNRQRSTPAEYSSQWYQFRDRLQLISTEIDLAITQRAVLKADEEIERYSLLIQELQETKEFIIRELTLIQSQHRASHPVKSLPKYVDIQAKLAPDTLGVDYFVADGDIYACLIQKEHSVKWVKVGTFATLQASLEGFNDQIELIQNKKNPDIRWRAAKAYLKQNDYLLDISQILLAPLFPYMEHMRQIFLFPAAEMYGIPWFALPYDEVHLISQKYIISVKPTPLLFELDVNANELQGEGYIMGWVGDPPLKYFESEIERVSQCLPNAHVRKSVVTADMEFSTPPRRLHILTHAVSDPANPALSYFQFSDDNFYLLDLFRLDFTGTELVVLSGCQTGVVSERGGASMALNSAFLLAGAQTVLASLWKVEDEAGSLLIAKFYECVHLGLPPSQAIVIAQKELRTHDRFSHPFYWGAFYPLTRG